MSSDINVRMTKEELKKWLAVVEENLETKIKEYEHLQSKNKKLEEKEKQYQTKFDQLDKENHTFKMQLADREEQVKNLQSTQKDLAKELKQLSSDCTVLTGVGLKWQSEAEAADKNAAFWIDQAKREKEFSKLKKQEIYSLECQNKELWEMLDKSNKESERLSGVEDALNSEIDIQRQHAVSLNNMVNSFKDKYKEKKQRYDDLKLKYEKTCADHVSDDKNNSRLLDSKDLDISALRRANSDLFEGGKANNEAMKKFRSWLYISAGCLAGCIITLVYLLINR